MCSNLFKGLCPYWPMLSDDEIEWRYKRNEENHRQTVTCNNLHSTPLDKDRWGGILLLMA